MEHSADANGVLGSNEASHHHYRCLCHALDFELHRRYCSCWSVQVRATDDSLIQALPPTGSSF